MTYTHVERGSLERAAENKASDEEVGDVSLSLVIYDGLSLGRSQVALKISVA